MAQLRSIVILSNSHTEYLNNYLSIFLDTLNSKCYLTDYRKLLPTQRALQNVFYDVTCIHNGRYMVVSIDSSTQSK